jgi:hypothetical protein
MPTNQVRNTHSNTSFSFGTSTKPVGHEQKRNSFGCAVTALTFEKMNN